MYFLCLSNCKLIIWLVVGDLWRLVLGTVEQEYATQECFILQCEREAAAVKSGCYNSRSLELSPVAATGVLPAGLAPPAAALLALLLVVVVLR